MYVQNHSFGNFYQIKGVGFGKLIKNYLKYNLLLQKITSA